VSAVVVNGHAGEVTSLDRDERTHVIETARRVAGPAVAVLRMAPRLLGRLPHPTVRPPLLPLDEVSAIATALAVAGLGGREPSTRG
jgi:dihydrodipicolinate synthase/N-acetylneuraminate lyase